MNLDGILGPLRALPDALGAYRGFDLAEPGYAWVLWLLAAGLLWGALRWAFGQALPISGSGALRGAGWLRWLAPLPRILRYLGMALLLLALMRPQSVRDSSESNVDSLDIFLCLDISGSMSTPDLKPSRIEAAKATLGAFVDSAPQDRIGMVIFAGKAFVQCPLTLDHSVVKYFISQVDLSTIGIDGTALGDGLALAVSRLVQENDKSDKVIVLATDGRNNAGIDPMQAVALAAGAGIKVYTIGIGVKGGAIVQVPNAFGQMVSYREEEPDEDLLKAVAADTGGEYFRAQDADSLKSIYATIAKLQRHQVAVKRHRDVDEHFYPYLLAGAILLLLESLLRLRIRVTA
ncbi:MAG TPA: VWA domain-containing protein [bacterium]|nr:VWA domain-containing protein [bacterium]